MNVPLKDTDADTQPTYRKYEYIGIEVCKSFSKNDTPVPLFNLNDISPGDRLFFHGPLGWMRGTVDDSRTFVRSGNFTGILGFSTENRQAWVCAGVSDTQNKKILRIEKK